MKQSLNNASVIVLIVIKFVDSIAGVWHSLHTYTPQASHHTDSSGQIDAEEKRTALNRGQD